MRSSSSRTGSAPVWVTDTATSVGARSSFDAASAPAASLRRASAFGPTTRKRHGFVRLWFGAQRASSNSSSSVARPTGSEPYALCVRRLRIASSSSIRSALVVAVFVLVLVVQRLARDLLAAAVEQPHVERVAAVVVGCDQREATLDEQ